MKNKALIIGGAGLIALVVTAGLAASSFAYQGDMSRERPSHASPRHEAIAAVMTTGDYNAWKELMANKGRMSELINEDNFSQFVQAHELMMNGDITQAQAIRADLGLGQGNRAQGMRNKEGCSGAQGRAMHKEGVKGQNIRGGYIDANGDGVCDNRQ